MSRIECRITYGEAASESGVMVKCVRALCMHCGHKTLSFGQHDASVRRCLAVMREECPEGDKNFYVVDEDEHDDDALGAYS